MNSQETFIGVDFGSDSVRAILVTGDGEILASSVHNYVRWAKGLFCDPNTIVQRKNRQRLLYSRL